MSMQDQPFGTPAPGGFRPAGPMAQSVGGVAQNAVDPRTQATAPKGKDGKAPKAKGNKMSKRTLGVLAALLALVTFVGVIATLSESEPARTFVVRASTILRPQVPVDASALEAVPVDPATIEEGTISAPTAEEALSFATGATVKLDEAGQPDPTYVIVGAYPVTQVFAGQQIRLDAFESEITPVLGSMTEEERLVSLAVPFAYGVAGQLEAGNRVDVYAIDDTLDTAVLLRGDVEIVSFQADQSAIQAATQAQSTQEGRNQSAAELLPLNPIPGVYVLRIPVADSARFAVSTQTQILFVYRPPNSTETPQLSVSISDLFADTGAAQLALDAMEVIQTYATYQGAPMPGVSIYQAAGVNGVNANNLGAANMAVAAVLAPDIDTLEKLQALLDADASIGTDLAAAAPLYAEVGADGRVVLLDNAGTGSTQESEAPVTTGG